MAVSLGAGVGLGKRAEVRLGRGALPRMRGGERERVPRTCVLSLASEKRALAARSGRYPWKTGRKWEKHGRRERCESFEFLGSSVGILQCFQVKMASLIPTQLCFIACICYRCSCVCSFVFFQTRLGNSAAIVFICDIELIKCLVGHAAQRYEWEAG